MHYLLRYYLKAGERVRPHRDLRLHPAGQGAHLHGTSRANVLLLELENINELLGKYWHLGLFSPSRTSAAK